MSKRRTVRITLDITVESLPREDWENNLLQDDDGPPVSDDWPVEAMDTLELAECVEQATYGEELFAGSNLFLKVIETKIIGAVNTSSSVPAEQPQ